MNERHPDLCDVARSALVVVDVQERLMNVVHDAARVARETTRLIAGAKLLRAPAIATLQYPKGLGPLSKEVDAVLNDAPRIEKTSFSCADEPTFMKALRALDRDQVVLAGIEAHVCVLQTAFDLRARGFRVFVAADAVGSRAESNRTIALARLAAADVRITCVESVLFEWTRAAGTDVFKAVSALVR